MSDMLINNVADLKEDLKECKTDKKEEIEKVVEKLEKHEQENKLTKIGIYNKIEEVEESNNDKIQTIKEMLEGWKKSVFKIGLRLFIFIIAGLFAVIVWLLNFFLPALLEKIQSINIGG